MLGVGSRVSDHLLECHQYYHHLPSLGLGLGFGFCSNKIVHLSSLMLRPPRLRHRMISSSSRHWKYSGEVPVLHNCFSHREGERDHPFRVDGLSSVAGGIVALGKFDALHIGHRELAIQASRVGVPYLLSFVGMVEVLGWEPRAPIVAKCDRERILSSWAPYCRNVTPVEFQIDFSSVRHLTPRQFVEKLSKELRVSGVVAGENYRFGYKASGDASELVRLCKDYGIGAYIINSVMDKNQDSGGENGQDLKEKGQVSSTRVRHVLAMGDMIYVKQLLGRPHRLMLRVKDQETLSSTGSKWRFAFPKSCLLNLPPRDGIYDTCLLLVGDENPVFCSVLIDSTHVCLDTGSIDLCNLDGSQEFRLVGIEFGKSN